MGVHWRNAADRAACVLSPNLLALPNLRTPMGFGVAAVANADEARALAERVGGRVFTFQALLDRADLARPRMREHP